MYRIVFLTGPQKGRRLVVRQGNVLFGRSPTCAIRLIHPSVAEQHAVLENKPDGFYLRSLIATARFEVNDQPATGKPLQHGDEIELGRERFLFQLTDMEQDPRREKRRTPLNLAIVAVVIMIAIQIAIVLGLIAFWRLDPIEDPSFPIEKHLPQPDETSHEEE